MYMHNIVWYQLLCLIWLDHKLRVINVGDCSGHKVARVGSPTTDSVLVVRQWENSICFPTVWQLPSVLGLVVGEIRYCDKLYHMNVYYRPLSLSSQGVPWEAVGGSVLTGLSVTFRSLQLLWINIIGVCTVQVSMCSLLLLNVLLKVKFTEYDRRGFVDCDDLILIDWIVGSLLWKWTQHICKHRHTHGIDKLARSCLLWWPMFLMNTRLGLCSGRQYWTRCLINRMQKAMWYAELRNLISCRLGGTPAGT